MGNGLEPQDTRGLTQREILLEVRDDLKEHIRLHTSEHALLKQEHDRIDQDVSLRPTRQELFATLGGAGVLSGIIFGIIQLIK